MLRVELDPLEHSPVVADRNLLGLEGPRLLTELRVVDSVAAWGLVAVEGGVGEVGVGKQEVALLSTGQHGVSVDPLIPIINLFLVVRVHHHYPWLLTF